MLCLAVNVQATCTLFWTLRMAVWAWYQTWSKRTHTACQSDSAHCTSENTDSSEEGNAALITRSLFLALVTVRPSSVTSQPPMMIACNELALARVTEAPAECGPPSKESNCCQFHALHEAQELSWAILTPSLAKCRHKIQSRTNCKHRFLNSNLDRAHSGTPAWQHELCKKRA